MQIKIEDRIYNVEFVTTAKSPKYGKAKEDKVLVQTECNIKNSDNIIFSRGVACQNYRDSLNWHSGRKHALSKALKVTGFKKEKRTVFWNKYKEEYLC